MDQQVSLPFELVTLGGIEVARRYVTRDSATWRTLFDSGVPKDLLHGTITADAVVSDFDVAGFGPVLRFARSGGGTCFAVRPGDETVVLIFYPERRDLHKLIFVNSSLAHFVKTTRLLTASFPYEYWDDEFDMVSFAIDDLHQMIESVDPPAVATRVEDSEPWWHRFLADVGMGDYAQQEVLGIPWEGEPGVRGLE